MCVVNKCCCCVDLVEGVKVLGIAFFVVNIVSCIEQILVMSAPGVIIQLVLGLSSLCLIHGAAQRKRLFLLVWILTYSMALLMLLAFELYSALSEKNGLHAIGIIIAVPILTYALVVVGSLYRRLGDSEVELDGYVSV